jgi:hypothetical protein
MLKCENLDKYWIRTVMARLGVEYETIKQTAIKLLSQGMAPSVQKIREVLGTGSNSTIAYHLKIWREEHATKAIHHLPANMPKELISVFEVLWQTAMEQAENQLSEFKQAVVNEREAALQKERDTERSISDIQLKLEETYAHLMQETAGKHKLHVELAVTNDRLAKQDEAISVQKNQYEDRLKRVYDEKDNHIIEYRHLQKEVKSMQENLALQTMQQQNMLAQQNLLHEQSENRWLKLIDQARQEAKDTYKKYQKISTDSDEQIKRLNSMLADLQKSIFEKDTHIKIAQEKVSQLKQEIKSLETEHINARTIIMKLKGERESRNTKHKYKTDSIA